MEVGSDTCQRGGHGTLERRAKVKEQPTAKSETTPLRKAKIEPKREDFHTHMSHLSFQHPTSSGRATTHVVAFELHMEATKGRAGSREEVLFALIKLDDLSPARGSFGAISARELGRRASFGP